MEINVKYGLIGEKLGHSFSADIHGRIGRYDCPEDGGYDYRLLELAPGELDGFMRRRNFLGLNVTIPYKQTVIPYLDDIDETAEKIGSVNTIVNRGGRLFGYNTDFGGMRALIKKNNIEICGKKVMILGSGGTSKTAYAAVQSLGASEIICVSRSGRNGAVTYDEAYAMHSDTEIIINATPCGMFPNTEGVPVILGCFSKLSGVVDVIFNPLSTVLVRQSVRTWDSGMRWSVYACSSGCACLWALLWKRIQSISCRSDLFGAAFRKAKYCAHRYARMRKNYNRKADCPKFRKNICRY